MADDDDDDDGGKAIKPPAETTVPPTQSPAAVDASAKTSPPGGNGAATKSSGGPTTTPRAKGSEAGSNLHDKHERARKQATPGELANLQSAKATASELLLSNLPLLINMFQGRRLVLPPESVPVAAKAVREASIASFDYMKAPAGVRNGKIFICPPALDSEQFWIVGKLVHEALHILAESAGRPDPDHHYIPLFSNLLMTLFPASIGKVPDKILEYLDRHEPPPAGELDTRDANPQNQPSPRARRR